MSEIKTTEARLNVFIRLLGILFISLGGAMAYYTATTNLTPQLPAFFYMISFLMIASGLLVLVAKLE